MSENTMQIPEKELEKIAEEVLEHFLIDYNLIRKNMFKIARYLAVRPGDEFFPCDATLRIDCSVITKLEFARMFILVVRDYLAEKFLEKVKTKNFMRYLEHAGFTLRDLESASVLVIEVDKDLCTAMRRTLDYIRSYAERVEYELLVYACRELRKCFGYDTVKIPDIDWFISVTDALIEHVGRLIRIVRGAMGTRPDLAKEGELLEKVYTIARDHALKLLKLELNKKLRSILYEEADQIVKKQWHKLITKSQEEEKEELKLEGG